MSEPIIHNLDDLLPQDVTIRLGGKDIKLNPPTLRQTLELVKLTEVLKDTAKLSNDQIVDAIDNVQAKLKELIPELSAMPELRPAQISGLVKLITDITTPQDTKELQARNIQVGDEKKDPA